MSSRVLLLLGADGHLVRGRPRAAGPASQHRWTPHRPAGSAPRSPSSTPPRRRSSSSARGSRASGPARWPTSSGGRAGPSAPPAPRWPSSTPWRSTSTASRASCWPATTSRSPPPEPWVALLPEPRPDDDGLVGAGLVPRRAQARTCSTPTATPAPTIWADGRIVGGWAQRKDGEVVTRSCEDRRTGRPERCPGECRAPPQLLGRLRGDACASPRRWTRAPPPGDTAAPPYAAAVPPLDLRFVHVGRPRRARCPTRGPRSPSSAGPTSASRRCSTRWPTATASPRPRRPRAARSCSTASRSTTTRPSSTAPATATPRCRRPSGRRGGG